MTDQQRRDEPSAAFKPKRMKLSMLTAALQELTPRSRRDPDPDLAIEEWLDFASTMKCPNIQLSAAVHRSLSDVPAEALLDPVANTLDLRAPFDRTRAARVASAMKSTGVALSDLGYFDNMLAADPDNRARKHDFTVIARSESAWPGLQSRAVSHAGVNDDRYVAQQPGVRPGPWIALHRICERHGVGDQFRIHYDPSHAILMGQDTRSIFQRPGAALVEFRSPARPNGYAARQLSNIRAFWSKDSRIQPLGRHPS